MEELIWKYIDNDCTEDEELKFQQLLDENKRFKSQYEDILRINQLLEDQSFMEMSPEFKVTLASKIADQVSQNNLQKTEIFPKNWIIPLVILGITSMVLALIFPSQSSTYYKINIPLDDRTIVLATWSMMAFVCLTVADYFWPKIHHHLKPLL